MASQDEHRQQLRAALDRAVRNQGLSLTSQARAIFVNRAITHIYARFQTERNRDQEVQKAVEAASSLARNLAPIVENRIVKSLDESIVQNFVANSVNCIYPYCRPTP